MSLVKAESVIIAEMGALKSGTAKLSKHPNCHTLYLPIPAKVVQDSTFPFKAGERVDVEIEDISINTGNPLYILTISKQTTKETTKK